jgi:hypothetical protein
MKFENSKMKISMLAVLFLIVGSLSLYSYANRGTTTQSGETYHFIKPVFAQSMSTAPTFLDEEAGISLYVNIGQSIDLAVAKTVYRALEKETADYAVGSVNVSTSENEDVHCFVHKNGWIVTYYLKGEPVSKIVDWNLWSQSTSKLTKNKLQVGLEKMANTLGVWAVPSVSYYHFQHPNATKCMIILETLVGSGEDSFNVTIPNDIAVYERSWSHYAQNPYYYHSYFKIDGNTINSISSSAQDPMTNRGTLIVAQLFPSAGHVVSVSSDRPGSTLYGVCVALVYQEP